MGHVSSETLTAINKFLELVRKKYRIEQSILYGSRARGDQNQYSDADLALVVKEIPGKRLEVKLDMADIAYDVMLDTDLLISPLPLLESEYDNPDSYSNPSLIRNIRREGVSCG